MNLKSLLLTYQVGGNSFTVEATHSAENDHVFLPVRMTDTMFSAEVKAKVPVVLTSLKAVFSHNFAPDCRIFMNGYQSWTDSMEHTVRGRVRGIDSIPKTLVKKYAFSQYGDYTFTPYSRRRGQLHGFSYGYVRSGSRFDLMGSLNEDCGFTILRTDCARGEITFEKDCAGLHVDNSYRGLQLCLLSGTEAEVFDGWFSLLGIRPSDDVKPVCGYTSWYRHYQDIGEKVVLHDLSSLLSLDITPDIFQIDDGYQTAVGDWLSVDSVKFPNGMKPIADVVNEAGLTPGIWLAPFVCEETSELYREKPHWLLRDENGAPVKAGSNWSGFYALDVEHPEVREYLRTVFDTVVNKWGYRLLKLDFLYAACLLPRRDKTRGQIMAEAMDFLRECTEGAQILGCGVPLASAFGKVDYCRIGCDVSLDWDNTWLIRKTHRERTSTRNCLLNSVFRRQLDGRAFRNDPDVFLLRSGNLRMTPEQKQTLGEINALTGSVLFTSDDAASYTAQQKQQLDEIWKLRDATVMAASLKKKELLLTLEQAGKRFRKRYKL